MNQREKFNRTIKDLILMLKGNVRASRENSLVITKLEEAELWFSKCVTVEEQLGN